jgi:hypothetical protein
LARICGAKLWREAVARSCGAKLWREAVARSCGAKLWREAVARSCGAKLWRQAMSRSWREAGANLPTLLESFLQPFEEHERNKMGPVVSGAVITSNGKLSPSFEYIEKLRAANSIIQGDFSSEKKALILGSGYVSAPLVEYLTRDTSLGVTVASALKEEAKNLAEKYVSMKTAS